MHSKEILMPKRLMADPDALTYNYGKFIVEPLLRGFGTTLGNALRRVLLSSIKGAAITAVKIEGVLHEFSTIPCVIEDAVQIVLNLKDIRFALMGDGPVTLYLDVKDMGEVTAADIQPNSKVEIMSPDQHIATLDKNGELKMEIYVDSGHGYISAEKNESVRRAPGIIPVDSIFSPIRKVNFWVENRMLAEQSADCDRLIIEVWTDGSINARDAISEASSILVGHLNIFMGTDESVVVEDEKINEEIEKRKAYLLKPVAELELSVRAANCLAAAEIITIQDLVTKTEPEMLKYRNFGRKSLNEIKAILGDMGLSFGLKLDDNENEIKDMKDEKEEDYDNELEETENDDLEESEEEEPEDAS